MQYLTLISYQFAGVGYLWFIFHLFNIFSHLCQEKFFCTTLKKQICWWIFQCGGYFWWWAPLHHRWNRVTRSCLPQPLNEESLLEVILPYQTKYRKFISRPKHYIRSLKPKTFWMYFASIIDVKINRKKLNPFSNFSAENEEKAHMNHILSISMHYVWVPMLC